MKNFTLFIASMLFSIVMVAQTANTLTTTFTSNNGRDGNMFHVVNISLNYISIDGFDLNVEDSTSSFPVAVFYRMNTYISHEGDSLAWTMLQNDTIVSLGRDFPSHFDMNQPVVFAPGDTIAFYISVPTAYSMRYTNGVNTYDNGELQLISGIGNAAYFNSSFNADRMWNGTVYYHQIGDQQTVTEDTTICIDEAVLLQASAMETQGYEWYDMSVGGNILSLKDTLQTPILSLTTEYYVNSLHNYYYDNVEDNNMNEYVMNGSNFTTSTDFALSGNYSLKFDGTYGASENYSLPLNGVNPNYIAWSIYPTTANASQALFVVQDGSTTDNATQMIWAYVYDGTTMTFVNGGANVEQPVSLNQWYNIELKNINYETQTLDIWLNGLEIATDVIFRGAVKNVDGLYFGNYSTAVAYYDNIEVGALTYSPMDTVNVTVEVCTGITNNGLAYTTKIYPIPTSDILNIETETEANNLDIIISDINGKTLIKKYNLNSSEEFDISSFNPGVYFIQLIYDGKVETKRIIKK